MASTVVGKRLINREEYHKMGEIGLLKPDENVELINGEIYNKAPIGSRHFAVVNKLTAFFVPVFVKHHIVSVQNPIHIDHWNEPEPDLVILKQNKEEYMRALPQPADVLAVIEVADTSYNMDKNVKLPLYASSGIPIYWIVKLSEDIIEVYSYPRSGQYSSRTIYYPTDKIPLLKETFDVSDILVLSS